jgi:hypothetical protein
MDIAWAMRQKALYHRLAGHDGWGRVTYYPPRIVTIRLQGKQRLIRAANGEEVMCDAEVWAPLCISPGAGDLFTCQGNRFRVLAAGNMITLYGGSSHWKLFCASVQEKLPGDIEWPEDGEGGTGGEIDPGNGGDQT